MRFWLVQKNRQESRINPLKLGAIYRISAMKTVGVIFGGRSGEHQVSIASAQSVGMALKEIYQIIPFYIDAYGNWADIRLSEQVLATGKPLISAGAERWAEFADIDVFFPVIHGPYGEDGKLQGLLDMFNKKYVGNGVLASAVGMDKIMMKSTFAHAGLAQVQYLPLLLSQWQKYGESWLEQAEIELGYPCFVKPSNLGSSVGISKVRDRQQLKLAIDLAFSYDRRIIIEQGVQAREIECAVLGDTQISTSCVGEVTYASDFYDYETKYTAGKAQYIIPAEIPDAVEQAVQSMSVKAFQAIGGRGLARVDFFYLPASATVLINEINTLPGFTNTSGYPKFWQYSGLNFRDLCDRLVQLALKDGLD